MSLCSSASSLFEYYTKEQPIFADDVDSNNFLRCVQLPLPTTFWINEMDAKASLVNDLIKEFHSFIKPLEWYPNPKKAWRVAASRSELKEDPLLRELHKRLVLFSTLGVIYRQEEVSMIPVVLLNVEGGEKCLDMCASPGSKTAQILHMMWERTQNAQQSNLSMNYHSSGLVIANDNDPRRANMLIHRLKRLHCMYPYTVFTTHDARRFPHFDSELRFDKVLCDVPCSGDGTLRKNTIIFKQWSQSRAYILNPTQFKIAVRGAQLMKVGGRLVYSTCSLNPIENEAVVYHLLLHAKGALELVEMRHLLSNFRTRTGLTRWSLHAEQQEVTAVRLSDLPNKETGTGQGGKTSRKPVQYSVPKTAYPPTDDNDTARQLHKCIRVAPHDQDTGGFFIAVLHKLCELPETPTGGANGDVETPLRSYESPYYTAPPSTTTALREFYGLNLNKENNWTFENLFFRHRDAESASDRNSQEGNTIYLASKQVSKLLACSNIPYNIVNAGLRLFVRDRQQGVVCVWRPCNEGATIIYSALSEITNNRVLSLSYLEGDEILKLTNKTIATKDIRNQDLRQKVWSLSPGGLILLIESKFRNRHPIIVAGLRLAGSLQICAESAEIPLLLLQLGETTQNEKIILSDGLKQLSL